MKEYLIAYRDSNNMVLTTICCGNNMKESLNNFRLWNASEIIAITELDNSINSNCL